MLCLGLLYAFCINANINGISHNFIHNPYFRSPLLNRLFSLLESVTCCFSQTYYDVVHMQHHKGNSDRQDETAKPSTGSPSTATATTTRPKTSGATPS